MTKLTERERELVAIGASIGSNCVPCIAYHVGNARKAGLSDAQIEAAVVLSEEIRKVPASLVVDTARAYLIGGSSSTNTVSETCECNNTVSDSKQNDSNPSKCGC
jgi:AhpD family alkylhydroperoxidase